MLAKSASVQKSENLPSRPTEREQLSDRRKEQGLYTSKEMSPPCYRSNFGIKRLPCSLAVGCGLVTLRNVCMNDRKKLSRLFPAFLLVCSIVLVGAGCSDADIASENISRAADQFEITRRIVFYNGISGEYILTIEGLCSLGNYDSAGTLTVTCKTGRDSYKKHFLGLSDNVTYFAEQIEGANVSEYRYRVIFKPAAIVPDIDLE